MKICLENVSKKFQRHWIFKDISYSFENNGNYALLGSNGSGKSTLLRIIAGMQSASKGKINYFDAKDVQIPNQEIFKNISFSAPSQELVEELTLKEFLEFHFSFKKILPGLEINSIIDIIGLGGATNKPIGDYSSGMRQRVKLAQAIFTDTPVLMLDEPCTNLDQKGVEQYRNWIETYSKNKLIIVASNDIREYFFCNNLIEIEAHK